MNVVKNWLAARVALTDPTDERYAHLAHRRPTVQPKKQRLSAKMAGYVYEFAGEKDQPVLVQIALTELEDVRDFMATFKAEYPDWQTLVAGFALNLGCPQGFAMRSGYGAGAVRKLGQDAVVELVRELCAASAPLPVEVKLRIHREGVADTLAFCQRLQRECNIGVFTLHGRTAEQKGEARGRADWDAVKQLREALPDTVRVFGNGDIRTAAQLRDHIQEHGAVCVGYGALRDPRLFLGVRGITEDHPDFPTRDQVITTYLRHVANTQNSLLDVKRHLRWMLKEQMNADEVNQLFRASTVPELLQLITTGLEHPVALPDAETLIAQLTDRLTGQRSHEGRNSRKRKR